VLTLNADFTGLDWWTHGRLVNYNQPNPSENDISNWLIQNPQRLNLVRIAGYFNGTAVNESQLEQKSQELDLWSGKITSSFSYKNKTVTVETWCHPYSDAVGINVTSELLKTADIGVSIDFPYADVNKFDAPFVGVWNATEKHSLDDDHRSVFTAYFQHYLDNASYSTTLSWDSPGRVLGPTPGTHQYNISLRNADNLLLVAVLSRDGTAQMPSYTDLTMFSEAYWEDYWTSGAFVDISATDSPEARELQRRIILSQYLAAVNLASSNPPQESGLVNTGWYGKFHMEMVFWHLMHFARWNHWDLLSRSMPNTYERFLQSSYDRARDQGYKGARWGKMTDPAGRSAPGEINSLLIWQQPHPMYFAEIQYRSFPNTTTLTAWDEILTATADFMASYAFYNESTGVYDLGPPMYPVSENTNPNMTTNPTFELAYWRFGLDVAARWKQRQNMTVPETWTTVRDKLAPLPVVNGTFAVYEGVPGMWTDKETTSDHPALAGVYGWLPPPESGPPLDLRVVRNTAAKINETWALNQSYGWDFAVLAMNSLRLGDARQAVEYLLHPAFQFDDAGYPVGGSRVATPYFPNAASLLLTVAMMAGGWDGHPGSHFPEGWNVTVEGFVPGL